MKTLLVLLFIQQCYDSNSFSCLREAWEQHGTQIFHLLKFQEQIVKPKMSVEREYLLREKISERKVKHFGTFSAITARLPRGGLK